MLKSGLLPGGTAAAAGSKGHADSVNTQLTQISLLGQAGLGWCEPWANVAYSWKTDSAVFSRTTNTATAAILYLQCIAPWQSISLSSCFTFWPLRGRILAVNRLFLNNLMGQIENFMEILCTLQVSVYNSLCLNKNGQFLAYPSPDSDYSSVLVHLRHLIQNSHQLFPYFTFLSSSFCIILKYLTFLNSKILSLLEKG